MGIKSLDYRYVLQLFLWVLLVVSVCTVSAHAQVKRDVKLRGYDPDASVTCQDNHSYTAAKGCLAARGRISQFSMNGFSPVIGVGQCIPQMSVSANPVVNLTSDDLLNNAQIIRLEDGNIIAVTASSEGVFFNRYDATMRLQSSRVAVVDMSEGIGFEEHNNTRNDNLRPLSYFKAAPLDGARWVVVFLARSAQSNKVYVMGAVLNGDDVEEPSETPLSDDFVFPISYEGNLFSDSATAAADIPNDAPLNVVGLKNADGTLNGKFVVAWVRDDYFKPSQGFSIFGKLFDESISESTPSVRFGIEQDSEIRMENTAGSLRNSVIELVALRSSQGFALAHNDPFDFIEEFSGASQEAAVRLFEADGDLYRDSNNDVIGIVGDIRRIVKMEALTSGYVLLLHQISGNMVDNKRLSATILNVTTPEAPTTLDLNGGDAGVEKTLTQVNGNMRSLSVDILPGNRTKFIVTWLEDRISADSVRSILLNYDAGEPTVVDVSNWFRLDTAGEGATPMPLIRTGVRDYVTSQHLQTVVTPLGEEHYMLAKYEGNSGRAVYRQYKISGCW